MLIKFQPPLLSISLGALIRAFFISCLLISYAFAADGKLISTAGVSQVEGAGGGGLVPWATLSGYDSREQISTTAFLSKVNIKDYELDAIGASISFYDRVEVSFAEQNFTIDANGVEIKQNIFGLKTRLYGDVIYSKWPQISAGLQYKTLKNSAVADALNANNSDNGSDFYLSFTKVNLGALFGFNTLWNSTIRYTNANQLGLLGFGGPNNTSRDLVFEASAAFLLNRYLAIGAEYRQKPNNLNVAEDDWRDVFISYSPSKSVSLTLAWLELGTIAGADDQDGYYISLVGHL
jgi:hypothetical protein